MSEHPWRNNRRTFTCPPECPNRKPACQDHCERYARDKARHNEHMEAKRQQQNLNNYVMGIISSCKDASAKNNKHGRPYKAIKHKW